MQIEDHSGSRRNGQVIRASDAEVLILVFEGTEDLVLTLTNADIDYGTATIDNDVSEVDITELDQTVEFTITDTEVSISEDLEESDTFTISVDQAIAAGNQAYVDVTMSGLADDTDLQSSVGSVLTTAATAANVGVTDNGGGSWT